MSKHALYKTTGIFGVAVLALTACGPEDEGAQEDVDHGGQEDVDPDGAEDQGDTPGEIADEDGDEPDPDEDEDAEAGDAPDLADIEDSVWEASSSQESVTITSEVPASMLGMDEVTHQDEIDDLTEDDEEASEGEAEEVAEEEETLQVVVAGDMTGDGSVWQLEDLVDYLLYDGGDSIYQTVDSFIEEYREFQPDEAAGPDPEDLREALEPEGSWVDVTTTLGGQIETPQQYVENFRTEMLASAGMDSLAESGITGETDTRDGEDVWVYREEMEDEFIEFVITADEDEPLLSEISMDSEGAEISISFTEWNESDDVAEDEPAEDEIITEDELESIAQGLM
ncbi:hypothetical protein [Nesterenkonia haasae]|uniref:hypothetical protein n=1 Tax=Nesterenkonia haasae TaxID=2587813 RepID=UPI001390E637|nr:hypothetical protein [Nesterenkonia haasae]NDK31091.1 hypothetical protein [Nesterenkonia haasae]